MKWQPIETYDALKTKPKYAVFWVEYSESNYGLPACIWTERHMGRRNITHWSPVEPPK